jgi:hypothetical protein
MLEVKNDTRYASWTSTWTRESEVHGGSRPAPGKYWNIVSKKGTERKGRNLSTLPYPTLPAAFVLSPFSFLLLLLFGMHPRVVPGLERSMLADFAFFFVG